MVSSTQSERFEYTSIEAGDHLTAVEVARLALDGVISFDWIPGNFEERAEAIREAKAAGGQDAAQSTRSLVRDIKPDRVYNSVTVQG